MGGITSTPNTENEAISTPKTVRNAVNNVTGEMVHNLSEAMATEEDIQKVALMLKDLGIEEPNNDKLKTIANNLLIILNDNKKKGLDEADEIDIKYALLMGKSYEKKLGQSIPEKILKGIKFKKMYKLIEIVERFSLRFYDFIDFADVYDAYNDIGELESKLAILQFQGELVPKTRDQLVYYLKNMDVDFLKKCTEENQGNFLSFYDLVKKYKEDMKEKLALFEGMPFAPTTEEEKSRLKNIDKLKLITMIDVAEEYGCKSFEKFMEYENLGDVDEFYKKLSFFKGKLFAPKTKTGRAYIYYKIRFSFIEEIVDKAVKRGCESFEEFMDMLDIEAARKKNSAKNN